MMNKTSLNSTDYIFNKYCMKKNQIHIQIKCITYYVITYSPSMREAIQYNHPVCN